VKPRLRYYLGNGWRLVTMPWRQRSVSLEITTNIFGCSFGPCGWHHLVEMLKEYKANPDIFWRDTTLYRYHKNFKPKSIRDLVVTSEQTVCNIPLFTYPWGTFVVGQAEKNVLNSRFCGPSTDEFIEAEYLRIITLYEQVKENSYKPWRYGHGFIGGTFMIDRNGRRRFVVMQGNHRMAVLASLGVRQVKVRTYPGFLLTEVREGDVHRWPLVRDGRCTPDAALAIFRMYFEENGEHVRRWVSAEQPVCRRT